jgi:hypothetical protein
MSRVVVALLLILVVTGCEATKPAAKPAPAPQAAGPIVSVRSAPATRPAGESEASVVVEEPGSTPQSLATDAAAYARAIEKQLEDRQQREQQRLRALPQRTESKVADQKPVQLRTGLGDEVHWLDAREIRLSLDPPVQPVHAVQMSAGRPFPVPTPSLIDVPVAAQAKPPVAPATRPAVTEAQPQRVAAPADDLEGALSRQVRMNPRDVVAHLDYQLLQFLRGQPVPQMTAIGSLSAEDREVVAAVMDALSNFRTGARSADGMAGAARFRPLVELSERVRASGNLSIPTAALCTRVDGFGIYEPAESRFPAGRESRVILYCEIDNFASQLNARDQWETRLTLETTLYDSKGTRVAVEERRPVTDLSRNRRRDFFARGFIRIPPLAAGQYSLTVTVTDVQANRIAEARVPVEVGQ